MKELFDDMKTAWAAPAMEVIIFDFEVENIIVTSDGFGGAGVGGAIDGGGSID